MSGEVATKDTERWRSVIAPAEFSAPNIVEEYVNECPVCTASTFSEYAVGFDYELQTCSNPWRFVECSNCEHVWLNPRPAIAELSKIYPPHYYAYDFESKVNPIALKGKALLDNLKMRGVFARAPSPLNSFLDIGCGSGRFLRVAAARGIAKDQIYGLELDDQVVTRLKSEGFQAYSERVEACDKVPSSSIDLAVMFHVIEHVDDPFAVVSRVRDWLSPNGVFALETPNLDSLDARLFRETFWGGYHIPRHWNLFTPATITKLLERAGMQVESIRFQTGHSFWMYSFHHALRYGRLRSRRLGQLFDPLTGLPFLIACTAFDKLRAAAGAKTSAMLILARRGGK